MYEQNYISVLFFTYSALQVQVITVTVHQSYTEAELKCLSSCSPAGGISYVWFKNGQKVVKEETSLYSGQFNPSDNVSCAMKAHEDYRSPSVCEFSSPCQSVSVFSPKIKYMIHFPIQIIFGSLCGFSRTIY